MVQRVLPILHARDQARAAVEGHVIPRPFADDRQAAAVTHQINNVYRRPDEPSEKAAEADVTGQVRHGPVAADGGEVGFVPVGEAHRLPAREGFQDVVGGVTPLLHGWRAYPG